MKPEGTSGDGDHAELRCITADLKRALPPEADPARLDDVANLRRSGSRLGETQR